MRTVKPRSNPGNRPPAPAEGSALRNPKGGAWRGGGTAARPKRDPRATRAALIDAAAKIFKREGYFATDSNAIARRAGYAPGSFYNHFADKTAILLAVYEQYVEQEWDGIRQAMALHPKSRIPSVLEFLENLHGEWARFRTDLRTVAQMEPAVTKALAASRAKQMELLAGLSGLSRTKDGPRLLIALTLVERYAGLIAEGHALGLQAATIRREMAASLQRALR